MTLPKGGGRPLRPSLNPPLQYTLIKVKFGMVQYTMGPLSHAKFCLNWGRTAGILKTVKLLSATVLSFASKSGMVIQFDRINPYDRYHFKFLGIQDGGRPSY